MNIFRYLRKIKNKPNLSRRLAIEGGNPVRENPILPVPYEFTELDAQNVADIVRSGKLIHDQGEEMVAFEREFASYTGSRFAIATNSGTSALTLACHALNIKRGDEVIVPAYTFVATAQAVLQCGAVPVFADIDDTFTLSPTSVSKLLTRKTKAIIVVHMFGNVAHDEIFSIASHKHIPLIEDCAQAVGAQYNGQKVGALGSIGCFSFNVHKALPTGQGGMLVTSSEEFFRRARVGRDAGQETINGIRDVVSVGGTFFMTEMEASLGRSVLRQLDFLNGIRRKNFEYLSELIAPLARSIRLYKINRNANPSYSRLAFLINFDRIRIKRDWFIAAMRAEGIPMRVFYPTPLYRYSVFQKRPRNIKVRFAFAEKFNLQHVGMEFSPYWDFADMRDIARAFNKVLSHEEKH